VFGESGETPERARRREALISVFYCFPQKQDTAIGKPRRRKQRAESKYPALIHIFRIPASTGWK